MANKKILTLEDQKHLFSTLPEIFAGLTPVEIKEISLKLGLGNILDENGNPVNIFTVDIHSNKPTYIVGDYNISMTANLFNRGVLFENENLTYRWERDSGVAAEDSNWALGKVGRTLTLTEEDFTSRINSRDVTFTGYVILNDIEYSDSITYSKSQIFNKIQIKSSHDLFLEDSPAAILMSVEKEGEFTNFSWFVGETLVSTQESFSLSVNSIALRGIGVVRVEATDSTGKVHTDSKTIPRISNGTAGDQGEPGVDGEPGSNSYTWIRYADDDQGGGMSEYPINPLTQIPREYLGLAPNKTTPVESDDPADYTWRKYIGTDGIPGENGYMWIKYSEYPQGRDSGGNISMFDEPFIIDQGVREDMVYMGIAYNKESQTEAPTSSPEGAPEVYTWAKIKGNDGHSNYLLDMTNENTSVPAQANGSIPNPEIAFSTARTTLRLYYGNDLVDPLDYHIIFTPSAGLTYTLSNNDHTLQITGMTADVGQVKIEIFSTDTVPYLITSGTFTVTKLRGLAIYEIFPSVSAIKINNGAPGQASSPEPTAIEAIVKMNTGDAVSNVTTGKLTYKYIYSNTNSSSTDDGTQITIGEILNINNSGNPLFLEFKYFHPVTNTLVDTERIPFVRDGVSGTSVEQRYRVSLNAGTVPDLVNTDAVPTGWAINPPAIAAGEALWMIKATKAGDTGNLIGTWSSPVRVSGTQGPQGPEGLNGTTGASPRLLEFVQGKSYENGGAFMDYAYFRTNNTLNEGWYTVKLPANHVPGTVVSVTYAGGIPDSTKFKKEAFTKEMSFGRVIAEEANLAGFIFRNRTLVSQDTSYQTCSTANDRGPFPNLTIDGIAGIIKFLEKMILSKDGIAIKDDCGNNRMVFMFENGVPVLRFFNATGGTIWEAGENNFGGTSTAFFSPQKGFKSSVLISEDPSSSTVPTSEILPYLTTVDNQYRVNSNVPFTNVYAQKYVKMNPEIPTLPEHNKFYISANTSSGVIADGWYITEIRNARDGIRGGGNFMEGVTALYTKIVGGIEVDNIRRNYLLASTIVYREYTTDLYGGSGDVLNVTWTDKNGNNQAYSQRGDGMPNWMSFGACAEEGTFITTGSLIEGGVC